MGSEHLKGGSELTVRCGIRKSRLHRNQYTISLLNEGLQAGLLTSPEMARIQHAFMQILQEQIGKFTRGESTSVSTETVESILSSIMYATDAYLFSLVTPEKAILYLKTIDVRHIYERGVKKVSQCFEEAKQLYKEIKRTKLEVPVDAYNLTIDESLPIFLRKYGIVFDAHNTMASIDYPLAIDDMQLQGVFYMKQYLERLKLENDFCARFDRQELLELLTLYGRECRFNYRIELFNIFELVFHQAIFSIGSGGAADTITISESQYNRLEQKFISLPIPQIRSFLSAAADKLQQELSVHSQMKEYMEASLEPLVQRVENAAKHNSLRAVILTQREASAISPVISFSEEDRMSDIELRRLMHEIMAVERKEDKVKLILASFHSLHDYLDMLESDSLYGDEFDALFHAFGDMELAVLAKIVFYEELRSEAPDLPSILHLGNEYPMEWQMQFVRCLQGMNRGRLQAIEEAMDQIDYEQLNEYAVNLN
ncbi:DUF6179 domain-containing protein [Gorillibacterium timonense]|uniref:DUF6179 domain-containing protein n=1 Tax=Gorillibacterium timonense TaxID=1689269 RepID=UPI00071CC71D|nr:DUF6179 domain-containing protein [Gorillibacterium timonense]